MDLEERPCPICSLVDRSVLFLAEKFDPKRVTEAAFSSRKLPEYMHFRLMKCKRCDIVYASPAVRGEQLADAYRGASFEATVPMSHPLPPINPTYQNRLPEFFPGGREPSL